MSLAKSLPSLKAKLIAPFRASPTKSWFLVALGVLLVTMWARMLVGGHGPVAAHASVAPIGTTISRTLDDSPAAPSHHAGGGTVSLLQWAREPIVPVTRNFFRAPLDHYPLEDSRHIDISIVGDGFWDRLAKSISVQADQEEQRQVLVTNLKTRAAELKLQSTMMGSQPRAMVNGEMVQEGSVVAGFRVLKIETRRMIIEREGIKLEIFMN